MKLYVALSKAEPTVKRTFLSAAGKVLPKPDKKQPYIEIDMLTWNKGSELERNLPTLMMLYLPVRQRGKGLGLQLLDVVLTWMKANNVKYLAFDNFANDFWLSALRRRPKNVVLSKPYRGQSRVGFVRTSASVEVDGLLW